MALNVKPLDASAAKFARNAAGASTEYAQNAVAAAEVWARNAADAAGNFRQAVTAGNIEARFRRGVQRAGSQKYSRKVSAVGGSRFSEGVAQAEGDWQTGFQPYAQTLAGLTLPSRRPRGDPGNYQRVQAVGNALNARRMALLAGGA